MAYVFSAVFRSFLGNRGYAKIRLNSHSFWQPVSAVKLEVIWHRRPGNTVFIPPCFSSSGATLKQALSIHRKEHISLFPLMWVAGEKKPPLWVFQPSSHTGLYVVCYIRLTRHLRAKVLKALKGKPHKQPLPLFFTLSFFVSAWILASPRAVPKLAALKSKLDKKRNELCNITRARAEYINPQEDININVSGGAHPTVCAGN